MPDAGSSPAPAAADELIPEAPSAPAQAEEKVTASGAPAQADEQAAAPAAEDLASAREAEGQGSEAEKQAAASPAADRKEGPILVISDLHGNLTLLKKALEEGVRLAGREDLTVVLIGDYCDNGPEIRDLLEFLCEVVIDNGGKYRGLHILPIIGNHDLICLLAASPGVFGARCNPSSMWARWQNYWNGWTVSTPHSYTTTISLASFRAKFSRRHRELLESLPWYAQLDGYVFVHAGLSERVPVEEQLRFLAAKDLSNLDASGYTKWKNGATKMPDQITNKDWASTNCRSWGCIVVTGHNKYKDGRDFVASNRLGLHSCACERVYDSDLPLHCALLRRGAVDLTQPNDAPKQFTVR